MAVELEIKNRLLNVAKELYKKGPGWAQEPVLLRRVAHDLKILEDIPAQQQMLGAWQSLFQDGTLVWGYNIDNPSHPFFHFPMWVDHESLPAQDLSEAAL